MELNDKEFEKYKRIIYKTANRYFYSIKKIEIDDLVSQGYLVLCRCINSFNPEKNVKFSTYLYNALKFELQRYIENQIKHHKQRLIIVDGDLWNFKLKNKALQTTSTTKEFFDAFNKLSKESQDVIKLVLDSPIGFFKHPQIRKELKKLLRSMGWRQHEIQKSFREIKTFLASY